MNDQDPVYLCTDDILDGDKSEKKVSKSRKRTAMTQQNAKESKRPPTKEFVESRLRNFGEKIIPFRDYLYA